MKKFSLSLIISGSFLFFSILFIFSFFIWFYNESISSIEEQSQQTLIQNRKVVEIILETYANDISKMLKKISDEKDLQKSIEENDGLVEIILQEQYSNFLENKMDYLFLKLNDNNQIINVSSSVLDLNMIIDKILTYPSTNIQYKYYSISKNDKTYIAIGSSEKIISKKNGRVLGEVFSGIILNDNLTILKNIENRLKTKAVAFAYDSDIIATTALSFEIELEVIKKILKSGYSLYSDDNYIGLKDNIEINNQEEDLLFINIDTNNILKTFNDLFFEKILIVLLFFVFIFLISYVLIKNIVVSSLDKIVHYASSVLENKKDTFEETRINEFNHIALDLGKIFDVLNQKQSFLTSLISSSNVSIIVLDSRLKITTINNRALRLFDLDDSCLGDPFDTVFYNIFEQNFLDLFEKIKFGKEIQNYETEVVLKNGDIKNVIVNFSVIINQSTKMIDGYIGQFLDSTIIKNAQKEILETKNTLQSILDYTSTIIYLKDLDGKYLLANRAYEKLFNLKFIQDVKGKTDFDLFDEQQANEFKKNDLFVMQTQEIQQVEENIVFLDEIKNFISIKFPLYDANSSVYAICGILTDITEIKKAEEKVIKLNLDLERKVKDRTKELLSSNEELSKTIQILQDTQEHLVQSEKMAALGGLVAGVAHEINTPIGLSLTGITHFQILVKKIQSAYKDGEITQEEFEDFINTSSELASSIVINLERAASQIRSFKQIAVDQSSDDIRVFNMKEYLNEIIISLKNRIKQSKVDIFIECDDNLNIKTYAGLFAQIVTNLVINSIIHGFKDKSGNINISVNRVGEYIHFIYKDDGVGIPSNNLPKIFDPFFTTNRENGGSGLGLNILYNIITRKLDGVITCESSQGSGVKFVVIFKEKP